MRLLTLLLCCVTLPNADLVRAQTLPSDSRAADQAANSALDRPITIDLRDVSLLEALFAIRDLTGVNLVVGNEVSGSVNVAFTETPVRKVLDTLLIPRGYSYRVVSGSLAILSLESIGDKLPSFETTVVRLQANAPSDLIPIVESLLSPEGRVHAVANSNSLMIMDYEARIQDAVAQINALERAAQDHQAETVQANPDPSNPLAAAGVETYVKVFQPQYVTAANLMESVRPLLTANGQISALDGEDKLVVSDSAETIDRIAQAIAQLDLPRAQVRVWALIYDCGLEDLEACGVNFSSGVNGSAMDAASGNPAHALALNSVTSTLATPANGVMTMSTINRLGSLESVIQALETSDDSRLLADPNVVVMNHEQAQIDIVTEVPYQQLTQGIDGGTIGTTEFREAGVTLSVTPHIAQDNTIAMVINPRFSLLTGFTDGDNAPIIDRRETLTTVRIENLQTLVLGGLRQRTRLAESSAIPGLSKVPYLGHLFKFRRDTARESELLVFITPEIVTPNYGGTAREICIGQDIAMQVDMTPTAPIPFGMDALRAERDAERKQLNQCRFRQCGKGQCTCGSCNQAIGLIGGYGAE